MWKSNCPLNLKTGCATLCSNNCYQAFAITGNVSFTSLWRNLAHSSCRIVLIQPTLEGFEHEWTGLRSCHSISIGFKSGLWFGHSITLICFSWSHSEVDLLVCLGSLSLLHNPSALQLEVTNWWPDISSGFFDRVQNSWFHQLWQVVQVLKLQSSPRPSHYHHDCRYDDLFMKCCVGFPSDVTGHTPSKKLNSCRISPQNICPKVLGIIKLFFGKCETSLCVLFGQQWLLPWNSPMDAVFAQSLSYCWIMNTDLNWGLQFFRCCSGFFYDLLDESSLHSWSNFGRPATPGKVHHCSKFSPFVDNGSVSGSLESQSLRNGFITLIRLIHVNYFVSHLFLNFFRSQHAVLLFKHASLCQTGSI